MHVGNVIFRTNEEMQSVRLDAIEKMEDGSGYGCELAVQSRGFACSRGFYFDDLFLSAFIDGLEAFDRGKFGEVTLKGTWETSYLRVELKRYGHVVVSGELFEYSELPQKLEFAFRTDQTILAPLVKDLRAVQRA